ncbi:MAG TPA: hypothetical protein PKD55_24090 [Bellilinea sp.]|nr:hypothetical protein [Bellilinea sp.]
MERFFIDDDDVFIRVDDNFDSFFVASDGTERPAPFSRLFKPEVIEVSWGEFMRRLPDEAVPPGTLRQAAH